MSAASSSSASPTANPSTSSSWARIGQSWGKGLARACAVSLNTLSDDLGLTMMPVPESFTCPITMDVMKDPVATVDGYIYERASIEQWINRAQQSRTQLISPCTGMPLGSMLLIPVDALRMAIMTYLAHRPELEKIHAIGRSFEEAAKVLESDLRDKEAMRESIEEEVQRLRWKVQVLESQLEQERELCRTLQIQLAGGSGLADEQVSGESSDVPSSGILKPVDDDASGDTDGEAEPSASSLVPISDRGSVKTGLIAVLPHPDTAHTLLCVRCENKSDDIFQSWQHILHKTLPLHTDIHEGPLPNCLRTSLDAKGSGWSTFAYVVTVRGGPHDGLQAVGVGSNKTTRFRASRLALSIAASLGGPQEQDPLGTGSFPRLVREAREALVTHREEQQPPQESLHLQQAHPEVDAAAADHKPAFQQSEFPDRVMQLEERLIKAAEQYSQLPNVSPHDFEAFLGDSAQDPWSLDRARVIGNALFKLGGMTAMVHAHGIIASQFGEQYSMTLAVAWDKIGDWNPADHSQHLRNSDMRL
eukprot:TRINITY_DN36470_c0_g1_i1.p1 TRINITY_DN36470_c0_g1~~TRINITY_DN36470_c0_g1_i1.p1  ORF type:complete len:532 (+),score=79.47 TRINITY_DN36470_c0_g1_i1:66-1661(+)